MGHIGEDVKGFAGRRKFSQVDLQAQTKDFGGIGPGNGERDHIRAGGQIGRVPENVKEIGLDIDLIIFRKDPADFQAEGFRQGIEIRPRLRGNIRRTSQP